MALKLTPSLPVGNGPIVMTYGEALDDSIPDDGTIVLSSSDAVDDPLPGGGTVGGPFKE